MRHRRLDPQTFQALQTLMSSGGLRVTSGLADAIRERREALQLSTAALAERMSATAEQIEAVERAAGELSPSDIVALAQALGVDLVWFVEREPSLRTERTSLAFDELFPQPEEGLELMAAFASIKDPDARAKVMQLAKRFAAEGDDGQPEETEQ